MAVPSKLVSVSFKMTAHRICPTASTYLHLNLELKSLNTKKAAAAIVAAAAVGVFGGRTVMRAIDIFNNCRFLLLGRKARSDCILFPTVEADYDVYDADYDTDYDGDYDYKKLRDTSITPSKSTTSPQKAYRRVGMHSYETYYIQIDELLTQVLVGLMVLRIEE